MSETALPSGSILSDKAIASAWEVWAKMRPLVVSAMVASAVVGVGFALLKTDLGISPDYAFPRGTLVGLFQALAEGLIATPVAVATHRLILKAEVTPGIIALRKSYEWVFFLWLAGLAFVPALLMDLSVWAGVSILAGAIGLAGLIVWLSSVLVFPAIAIETPSANAAERLRVSRKQMRGHYWLFIKALFMAVFPLLVLAIFVALVVIIAEFLVTDHAVPKQVWKLLAQGIISLFKPVSIMLGAAVASWLYLYVKDNPEA